MNFMFIWVDFHEFQRQLMKRRHADFLMKNRTEIPSIHTHTNCLWNSFQINQIEKSQSVKLVLFHEVSCRYLVQKLKIWVLALACKNFLFLQNGTALRFSMSNLEIMYPLQIFENVKWPIFKKTDWLVLACNNTAHVEGTVQGLLLTAASSTQTLGS